MAYAIWIPFFFVFTRYFSDCCSFSLVIELDSNSLTIVVRNCFIIVQIASGLIGAPGIQITNQSSIRLISKRMFI